MVSMLPQSNLSYFGDGVNIGGATGAENKNVVDGVEVTDPLIQGSDTVLPYNFIREVEVKAGGYEADTRARSAACSTSSRIQGRTNCTGRRSDSTRATVSRPTPNWGFPIPRKGSSQTTMSGSAWAGPSSLTASGSSSRTTRGSSGGTSNSGLRDFRRQDVGQLLRRKAHVGRVGAAEHRLHSNRGSFEEGAVGNGVGTPPAGLTTPDSYLMDIGWGGTNFSLNGTYMPSNDILIEASVARVNRHDTGQPATEFGEQEPFYVDYRTDIWSGGPPSSWDSFRYATMGRLAASLTLGGHTLRAGGEYKVNGTDNRYDYDQIYRYDTHTTSGMWERVRDRSRQHPVGLHP